ncbi:MAG: VOC family protein [Deltaproteobacteria bacterium]|nr:VOC family protein [Deltaproteobacteria bacterium]
MGKMKAINPYLTFNGNCAQAMTFYESCLGGNLFMMPYAEAPMPEFNKVKDRILHATLKKGAAIVMAADSMPGQPYNPGNNVHLSIDCESLQEIQTIFGALAEKGRIDMPLQDTFWGSHFGMLTDQFGVQWMLSFDKTS